MNRSSNIVNHHAFSAQDVVRDIWPHLQLPPNALKSLHLPGHSRPAVPSSYKIGILAQSSIGLSALAASLLYSTRYNDTSQTSPERASATPTLPIIPGVQVPLEHAIIEFKSERLDTIDGTSPPSVWGSIGGLHRFSAGGHVRIHDVFPNHALGTLKLLGLQPNATRGQVSDKVAEWNCVDLETAATEHGKLAIYALRSYSEWDSLPQAAAINDQPIIMKQLAAGQRKSMPPTQGTRCLSGLRVLEMSRVIAAPVAGKALAAHGADVLWVTSPSLPDQPSLDRDFGRGKRTIQLDINISEDKARLMELLRTCDVFIQGFRPGSLVNHGLSPEEIVRINPTIIIANLSAFDPDGPWSSRRGFDSLIQTCSGMNVSEAEHAGKGETARAMPCQALDHASGYLLATGVMAALYHRATQGGAWMLDASLAGVMKYLRSLGQYPGATAFDTRDSSLQGSDGYNAVPDEYFETRTTEFGIMRSVHHSATIDGVEVGWEVMPKPLGSDEAVWVCS